LLNSGAANVLQVFMFGSVPLKTYLPDGDIDLTALPKPEVLLQQQLELHQSMAGAAAAGSAPATADHPPHAKQHMLMQQQNEASVHQVQAGLEQEQEHNGDAQCRFPIMEVQQINAEVSHHFHLA